MKVKVKNFYKGANPFVQRNNTLYDKDDEQKVITFIEKNFSEVIDSLSKKDYQGFCVDVEFDRIVGLVRLGELAEDTCTVRVWCHYVPCGRGLFGLKWKLKKDVTPISTKVAEDLVYTCEQVERYGCPWSLKARMSDFFWEPEGLVM